MLLPLSRGGEALTSPLRKYVPTFEYIWRPFTCVQGRACSAVTALSKLTFLEAKLKKRLRHENMESGCSLFGGGGARRPNGWATMVRRRAGFMGGGLELIMETRGATESGIGHEHE